jgi:hypothetical protein
MKTKTFLLTCLLMGIGLTQVSAQEVSHLNDKGTGTFITTYSFDNFGNPVFCDGQQVDFISGTVRTHNVYIFKNGVFEKANEHYFGGEFHSSNPNSTEVFKFMEKDHAMDIYFLEGDPQPYGTDTFRYDIIGNEGSHYVATCQWDIHTQTFIGVIRAVCPGNNN